MLVKLAHIELGNSTELIITDKIVTLSAIDGSAIFTIDQFEAIVNDVILIKGGKRPHHFIKLRGDTNVEITKDKP